MHIGYRDLTRVRVEAAIAAAHAAANIRHEGMKGQVREIFIRDLLRPLLPSYIGLGTGEIINYQAKNSPQQDVVMYDTRILPPYLADPNVGIFPIESVLYAVEVKSTLTYRELEKAHRATTDLWDMDYLPGHFEDDTQPVKYYPTHRVVPSLFAFGTDLKRTDEIERYDRIWRSGGPVGGEVRPSLQVICVVGRGIWWWANGRWNTVPTQGYNFGEVIGYLAAIWNNYERVAQSRGTPRLGRYLLEF
jgi:hypothetical protein